MSISDRDHLLTQIEHTVTAVRKEKPLIHCLSATVSMSLVADGLLACGARPMMTETQAEAPVMDSIADGLLINLGTLSTDGMAGMQPTVEAAVSRHIPWVLDPAAVGIAPVRTRMCAELIPYTPAVIRANASEVAALSGGTAGRGPDATQTSMQVENLATALAQRSGAVVATSGDPDLICAPDGAQIKVKNGVELLTYVTGTGCLLGAMTAACAAVAEPFIAALTATAWMGVAGEYAFNVSHGPGSLKINLLDALYSLTAAEIASATQLIND